MNTSTKLITCQKNSHQLFNASLTLITINHWSLSCDQSSNTKLQLILNTSVLVAVLLFPPDKPHGYLKRNLRQPANPLLPETFADPPKRPSTPVELPKLKPGERLKVTRSGRLTIQKGGKHAYPTSQDVAPAPFKMNLSTGKSVVSRKVDCWMTFEEYDYLTRYHH